MILSLLLFHLLNDSILLIKINHRYFSGSGTFLLFRWWLYFSLLQRHEYILVIFSHTGYHFIGFLRSNKEKVSPLETKLKYLGNIKDLDSIIKEYQIEEVIIAIQTQEHNLLKQLITALFDFRPILHVKIIPDMYDIMLGTVKMNQVFGTALIEINQEIMPPLANCLQAGPGYFGFLCFFTFFISALCLSIPKSEAIVCWAGILQARKNWLARRTVYYFEIQINVRKCRKRWSPTF